MERPLGALEHSFGLYDQIHPIHFVLAAKLEGEFSIPQLRQSLTQVQQQHLLLRVGIETNLAGQPRFVEQDTEIPLRVVARVDDRQWQRDYVAIASS
jgi:hypothetical protein